MNYLAIKQAHVILAVTSVFLFIVRGCLAIWLGKLAPPLFRMIAHTVDTLLLLMGCTLLYSLSLNPLAAPWIALKLLVVAAYIVFGILLMRSNQMWIKILAFVSSLLLIAYVFVLALSKDLFGAGLF